MSARFCCFNYLFIIAIYFAHCSFPNESQNSLNNYRMSRQTLISVESFGSCFVHLHFSRLNREKCSTVAGFCLTNVFYVNILLHLLVILTKEKKSCFCTDLKFDLILSLSFFQ